MALRSGSRNLKGILDTCNRFGVVNVDVELRIGAVVAEIGATFGVGIGSSGADATGNAGTVVTTVGWMVVGVTLALILRSGVTGAEITAGATLASLLLLSTLTSVCETNKQTNDYIKLEY